MKTLLRIPRLALLLGALVFALACNTAHAQNGSPQSPYVITTAPYTITTSGYYILGNNINYNPATTTRPSSSPSTPAT